MADTQANLDELKARRQKLAGIKQLQFDNQSTVTDLEALDREIARMEAAVAVANGGSRTRYAAFSKGV